MVKFKFATIEKHEGGSGGWWVWFGYISYKMSSVSHDSRLHVETREEAITIAKKFTKPKQGQIWEASGILKRRTFKQIK